MKNKPKLSGFGEGSSSESMPAAKRPRTLLEVNGALYGNRSDAYARYRYASQRGVLRCVYCGAHGIGAFVVLVYVATTAEGEHFQSVCQKCRQVGFSFGPSTT